ncbi:HIT-like protein [Fistulina hepatica ATCC 64428]|uniref:HIT-like protein n=1 Tax=Fistulina hepatica ATCC 64428 TaxID=1128425 RepID=A0A0D7A5K8_9AGAR|nr:HIT-like protein [Fistulina hepatica ATCC 64428]
MWAWFAAVRERADVKINIVFPATEDHVRKYRKQQYAMFRESPELYKNIVEPYISSLPKSRTQWVQDILDGKSEVEKVLFSSSDFILLPDMKWDLRTLSSLYIVAIARNSSIKCLRDLRACHLPLLKGIEAAAHSVVQERWGLGFSDLRMFVHYQPTYYHFHVHIVNANAGESAARMSVGQAHLLGDVISLLEVDGHVYERMTLSYQLGLESKLAELYRLFSTTRERATS